MARYKRGKDRDRGRIEAVARMGCKLEQKDNMISLGVMGQGDAEQGL
jgi:hypothetical protein